jgi:hypothetical protein
VPVHVPLPADGLALGRRSVRHLEGKGGFQARVSGKRGGEGGGAVGAGCEVC